MTPEDQELLAYAAGLAEPAVSARVERWLQESPGAHAHLGDVVAAAAQKASADETAPNESARWAGSVDDIVAANRPTAGRPPRGPWLAAALVVLGLGGALLLRAPEDAGALTDLSAELCALELAASSLPHQTALACGAPRDALLGTAPSAELVELRMRLEAESAPERNDWLAARSMVALLEGDDAAVIALLERRLAEGPLPGAFYADLALAYRRSGDEAGARRAMLRAARDAPGQLPPEIVALYD